MNHERQNYPTDLSDTQWNEIEPVIAESGLHNFKWPKRELITAVDTVGNLLAVVVDKANEHDTTSGYYPALMVVSKYPKIQEFSGDSGYRGQFVDEVWEFLTFQYKFRGSK